MLVHGLTGDFEDQGEAVGGEISDHRPFEHLRRFERSVFETWGWLDLLYRRPGLEPITLQNEMSVVARVCDRRQIIQRFDPNDFDEKRLSDLSKPSGDER